MTGPERAKELMQKALRASKAEQTEVLLVAQDQELTRFANNLIHQNVAETDVTLTIRAVMGKRQGVATTNNLSDEGSPARWRRPARPRCASQKTRTSRASPAPTRLTACARAR